MAFYLTGDKLDEDAYERERDDLVKILLRHREARWRDKEDWASVIRETGVIGNYRWGQTRKQAMLVWESSRSVSAAGKTSLSHREITGIPLCDY